MTFKRKNIQLIFTTLTLTAALTGCSGGPSESDIKTTVQKQQDQDLKSAGPFGDMLPKITVLKKVGCKEDGEKAYRCDLEVEVTQMNNTQKSVAQLRFVKTSDGWMISK